MTRGRRLAGAVGAGLLAGLARTAGAQTPPTPTPPTPPGETVVALDPVVNDTANRVQFRLPTGATAAPAQNEIRIWKYAPPKMPEGEITLYPGPTDVDLGTWRRTVRTNLAGQGWTVTGDVATPDHANGRVGVTRFVAKGNPTATEHVYYILRGRCYAVWFTFGSGPPAAAWRPVIDAVVDAFRLTSAGDPRLVPPPKTTESQTEHFVIRAAPGVSAAAAAEVGADCEAALAEAVAVTGIPAPATRYVVQVVADAALLLPFHGGQPTGAVWVPTGPQCLVAAKSPTATADRARAVCLQHVHAAAGCHLVPGWLLPGLGEALRGAKRQKGGLAFEPKAYPLLSAAKAAAKGGTWKPLEVFFRRPAEEYVAEDPGPFTQTYAVAAWLRAAPDERVAGFVRRYLDAYRVGLDPKAARDDALGGWDLPEAEKSFDAWAKTGLGK